MGNNQIAMIFVNYALCEFTQKYQDAVALSLDFDNADLFITVTGSDFLPELRRLSDKRETRQMVELVNRYFHAHLDSILDDIMEKQVFGRVIGKVWVIEYQKR